MTAMLPTSPISPDNDHRYWVQLKDQGVAATGLTVTAYLAIGAAGTPISGSSVVLTEVGSTGVYTGVLDAADVNTALAAGASHERYSKPGDYLESRRLSISKVRIG